VRKVHWFGGSILYSSLHLCFGGGQEGQNPPELASKSLKTQYPKVENPFDNPTEKAQKRDQPKGGGKGGGV